MGRATRRHCGRAAGDKAWKLMGNEATSPQGMAGSVCLPVDLALFLQKGCLLGKQTKNKHPGQKFSKMHVISAVRNVKWGTN